MKQGIHPDYVPTTVTCTCGNTFETRSTVTSGEIRVDVCSACHPFYTGKQKILDTGGRVARFEARYGKRKKYPACTTPTGAPNEPRRRRRVWFLPLSGAGIVRGRCRGRSERPARSVETAAPPQYPTGCS